MPTTSITPISSSNIESVFPCVSRSIVEEEKVLNSRLLSESNVTNIIKSITDKESYVISWENNILKCVIEGYYFQIQRVMGNDTLYAHIEKSNNNFNVLKGDEDGGAYGTIFGGLVLTPTATAKSLLLCRDGEVPKESYYKFNMSSFHEDFTIIECGELPAKT